MSLVTVLNLSLSFVGRDILKEVNFQVEPGDRIGLVGPNGSGKTSLLRMIVGELQPDKGEIRITKGVSLGYLPQDIYEVLSGGLLQFVVDSVPSRVQLKEQMAVLESSLGNHPDPQTQSRLAGQLAEAHHKTIDLDTHYPLHLAEKILLGLGFKAEDFERPMSSLSGGWKMRAALAGLLYQSPDLLLLDEPTNHLDPHHQLDTLALFRARADRGGLVVATLHDPTLAARFADRALLLFGDGEWTYGPASDVLSAEALSGLYRTEVTELACTADGSSPRSFNLRTPGAIPAEYVKEPDGGPARAGRTRSSTKIGILFRDRTRGRWHRTTCRDGTAEFAPLLPTCASGAESVQVQEISARQRGATRAAAVAVTPLVAAGCRGASHQAHGAETRCYDKAIKGLAAFLGPSSTVEHVPGVGHFMLAARPAKFNARILRFLGNA